MSSAKPFMQVFIICFSSTGPPGFITSKEAIAKKVPPVTTEDVVRVGRRESGEPERAALVRVRSRVSLTLTLA